MNVPIRAGFDESEERGLPGVVPRGSYYSYVGSVSASVLCVAVS